MSFSEQLRSTVSGWPQVFGTAFLLVIVFLLLLAGVWLLPWILPSRIKISTPTGTVIEINDDEQKTKVQSVLVSPQDWNDSLVSVEQDDKVRVTASGKVNVAIGLLIKRLAIQDDYRELNQRKGKSRDVDKMDDEQVQNSQLIVPWNGPEGLDPSDVTDKLVRETQARYVIKRIIPNEKLGRLIIAIVPGDKCPSKGETAENFQREPYSSNHVFTAKIKGRLCLIVNDHRIDDVKRNQLMWDDNVGFFVATIKVTGR